MKIAILKIKKLRLTQTSSKLLDPVVRRHLIKIIIAPLIHEHHAAVSDNKEKI